VFLKLESDEGAPSEPPHTRRRSWTNPGRPPLHAAASGHPHVAPPCLRALRPRWRSLRQLRRLPGPAFRR